MTSPTTPHWKSRSAKAARTSSAWCRSWSLFTTAGLAIGSTDPYVLPNAAAGARRTRIAARTATSLLLRRCELLGRSVESMTDADARASSQRGSHRLDHNIGFIVVHAGP